MIDGILVDASRGQLLYLPLTHFNEGLAIKDIDGLDPVKASLSFSDYAGQDSSLYQSGKREKRNIVLKLAIEPNYTTTNTRDIRRRLYNFFMPKSLVKMLIYEDDGLTVEITGRVESMDAPRFTNDPDATVSIICENSNFVDTISKTVNASSTSGSTTVDVNYKGNVNSGFLFTIYPNRSINTFTIYNTLEDNTQLQMPVSVAMENGDDLAINTVPGNKYATLHKVSSGSLISVVYGIDTSGSWINLFPGLNKFRVQIPGATIPYKLEYTEKYGGL